MSLLPKADYLRPGAERAAREILDALAEGSVIVVDRNRAEAVLSEVLIQARVLGAKSTARTIADLLDGVRKGAEGKADPCAIAAMKTAVEIVREEFEVKP